MIKRAHEMGLIIGDIKENNIMIDEDMNPILIDVDNCAYKDYSFDLFPERRCCFGYLHNEEGDARDNDIILYTLMCLRHIFDKPAFHFEQSIDNIVYLIDSLPVSREIKNDIWLLLSDSKDKPYVSPVLEKIKGFNK